MDALLVIATFLPLLGAAVLPLAARLSADAVRYTALGVILVTLLLAGILAFGGPNAGSETATASADGYPAQYAQVDEAWLGADSGIDIRFSLALDGLSNWMFGLTALLMVTAALVSWKAVEDRPALFFGMLLLLETGCLGVFAARDIILFYVFFEFTLIPLFFLIGIWGSEQRRYAAIKFFLFTLVGSVITFLGLLAIVLYANQYTGLGRLTFSIPELTAALGENPMPLELQLWVFFALFLGFAIKVPLFPLHTWLPLAHVQAPTAGSVILAGVLLKIGAYGFLRFSVPMLPAATAAAMPVVIWLSVAGILYGALVALAQTDMKRLIAYSSVSHLGFCMLGIFALNHLGVEGGVLQMVNHGLSTGALFALVGMVYERYHTRRIADLGGLARRLPRLTFFMVLFTFSSIGLPGLNGFAGEFLLLLGAFQRGWADGPETLVVNWQLGIAAILAVLGVVLGAWYMLQLIARVFFGPLKEPAAATGEHGPPRDLTGREFWALAPLAVFVIWIGVAPNRYLQPIGQATRPLTTAAAKALHEGQNSLAAEVPPLPKESPSRAD